jgi:hypothetical protein
MRTRSLSGERRLIPAVEVLEARTLPTLFPPTLPLSGLNGANGFAINGVVDLDRTGHSVAIVGDLNGDGIDDLAVGVPEAPGGSAYGQVSVVFGKRTGFSTPLQLNFLNGNNGFAINGTGSYDRAGFSVSGAGDVNGDGLDDMIVGAPDASSIGLGRGQAYVVFGSRNGFPAALSLSALNGLNGFILNEVADHQHAGFAVSGAGDVNGDGLDDVIVGAPGIPALEIGQGQAYVVFGRTNFATSPTVSLGSLDGSTGFTLTGIGGEHAGFAVNRAGDVNGDGRDDVIIGAPFADAAGFNSGRAYVVFGQGSFAPSLALSALTGGSGFILDGTNSLDRAGASVSAAGDINGDGLDDLLVGAPYADVDGDDLGEAYVVFGKTTPFAATLAVSSLNGSNGFRLIGNTDNNYAGGAVAGVGDVNGDGLDDLIVGARGAGGSDRGQAYVVFGRTTPFADEIHLAGVNGGTTGFILDGMDAGDSAGSSVSGAGDLNGDGLADLVVGAPSADVAEDTVGQAYVIFGRANIIVTGPDKGAAPRVKVFRPDGTLRQSFLAYPVTFTGGVRVAVGDVTGDGTPDLLTGPGQGLPAQLKLFDGRSLQPISALPAGLFPYGEHFTGGVYVAAGDVSGDGRADIIVSPQKGPRPVKAYDAVGKLLLSFFPYGAGFTGGVRIAAGNLGFSDGRAEIVTARSAGVSQVRVWDPASLAVPVRSFKAFPAQGGNFVAVGNVDNDAALEVIVGAEGLQPPRVRWFDVAPVAPAQDGQLTAYAGAFRAGVRVAVLPRLNSTAGRVDFVTAPGRGLAAQIKRFDALTAATIDSFFAYDQDFKGGAFIASC